MRLLWRIRTWLAARRFAAMTRRYDAQIAAARQAHRATRPLHAQKQAFVHAALRGRG